MCVSSAVFKCILSAVVRVLMEKDYFVTIKDYKRGEEVCVDSLAGVCVLVEQCVESDLETALELLKEDVVSSPIRSTNEQRR